mgnify:CR=1 FL=1
MPRPGSPSSAGRLQVKVATMRLRLALAAARRGRARSVGRGCRRRSGRAAPRTCPGCAAGTPARVLLHRRDRERRARGRRASGTRRRGCAAGDRPATSRARDREVERELQVAARDAGVTKGVEEVFHAAARRPRTSRPSCTWPSRYEANAGDAGSGVPPASTRWRTATT